MRCDGSSGPIRYSSTTLGFTHTSASAWIISTSTAHAVEYTCIGTCIGAAPQISAHERAGRRKAGSWSCSALTRRRVTPLLFSCSSREKGRKGELERRFREILVSRKKTGFCAEVVHRGQPYLILENAFKPIFVPFVPKKSSLFHQI